MRGLSGIVFCFHSSLYGVLEVFLETVLIMHGHFSYGCSVFTQSQSFSSSYTALPLRRLGVNLELEET